MLTVEAVQAMIQRAFPGGRVEVSDMTGTSDHFEVEVVSELFEGKSRIDQHKMIHAAVADHLGGAIHALKIKTRTP
ncbi:MAG: BolA family transcriptional regulator [Planctomycetes bacterium]|nr:BolA family transcriptional regulator [Planctomycetota bacterium]MCB9905507.1 BolA family transcriptional regulator [Planctomycetota bacterium]